MAAGSRRLAAKFALALPAIGMALSLLALGALDVRAAAENPLLITAHLGFSDVVKAQQWMPITIAVTNNGPEIDGTLQIVSSFGGRPGFAWPATYERPVVIATGATKYFRTYVVDDSGMTVNVRIIRNGRILASQDAVSTRSAATLIGVLSDDSTALDKLAAVRVGGVSASVVHLALADLVDSPIALHALDLLVVDDFATSSLSPSQLAAIADYVRSGGSLLIGTGASWHRTLAGLPADILPMQLTGLATLASSSSLGGLTDIQVATGTLSGGSAWLSEGAVPLLAEKAVGDGLVSLSSFDWKQEPIASSTGTDALLRQVLVRSTFGTASQPSLGPIIGGFVGGPVGGQGGSVYQRSGSLSQVLGSLPTLDLPSLALTGLLVLVYVLLVGPINYFVLGALHRRALAWITLPLIAVVVAAGAYGGGIWTRGQSVQTNQLSILHLSPGSDHGYLEAYTGVVTPTRGDYEVGTGGRPLLVSPVSSYNGYGNSTSGTIGVDVTNGTVSLPGMTAFTLRGFATEAMVAGPQLNGHLRAAGGQLIGTVENRSSTTFSDSIIIAGDGFQKLGPLAPGAIVQVSFTPRTMNNTGPPAILTVYPNYSFGPGPAQPSEAQRQGEAKTRLLSLLQGSASFKGLPTDSSAPIFVGWTDQTFQDVTVNGAHPRGQATTAVAMTLPIEQAGAGPLPAGVANLRVVDFDGTAQSGQFGPGGLVIQSGTVTYQVTVPLSPGLHLAGASLSAVNPFFRGKVAAQNNGASTIRGEAWDWSRSAWVDIAYRETGTTQLPPEVVNPASSEVRFRVIVDNGSFLTTGITLAGDVR